MELPVHFSAVAPLYDDGADFFNDWDGRVTRVSARFTTRKDLLSDLCQRVPFTTLPRKLSSKETELETESIVRFQHAKICVSNRSGYGFWMNLLQQHYTNSENISILVVRHPFYRLFSTWNNYFVEGNSIGRNLLKSLSNFVPLKRVTETTSRRMLLSFKTFVKEFLAEKVSWFDALPALKPQVEFCDVCNTDWNYVVKLETWAEDFEVCSFIY